jgi:hypothetical protein
MQSLKSPSFQENWREIKMNDFTKYHSHVVGNGNLADTRNDTQDETIKPNKFQWKRKIFSVPNDCIRECMN